MFIIALTYVKPLEEIDALMPKHVAWLKRQTPRDSSLRQADRSLVSAASFWPRQKLARSLRR